MNNKLKDFSYILTANAINLILGVVTGFILPAFLSYNDYSNIKLFSFYLGYIGIMHLGLLDGIMVKFGAYNYDELPKKKFKMYLKFLIFIQIIEGLIVGGIILLIGNFSNRMIVNIFVIINMIIMNITNFFMAIHQITKRFKLFSINTILSKVLYVIGVMILLLFNQLGFVYYIGIQTIVNIIILVIYLINNKELFKGKSESIRENFTDIKELMAIGFIIMIGNFIALIILGIDRFFVDGFLTEYDFAMYSFAYSLVSLFFIVLNSLTTVMYPYLARAKTEQLKEIYEKIRFSISLFMSAILIGYFGIKFIVELFITKYTDALPILIFLIPTVIFNGIINILVINMYKVIGLTKKYFINNIVALIISIVTNIIAIVIFKSNISIAIATLISFIIWVIYSDISFKKLLKVNVKKIYIFEFIIVIIFILTAYLFPWYIGAIIYLSIYIMCIGIGYRREVLSNIKMFGKNNI